MRLTILSWKRLYTVLDLKSNFLYGIGSVTQSFSFTYFLYMRERFSAVGASCARDSARYVNENHRNRKLNSPGNPAKRFEEPQILVNYIGEVNKFSIEISWPLRWSGKQGTRMWLIFYWNGCR